MSIILNASDTSVALLLSQLLSDAVVAIPTETVYGLAANAYSTAAVLKIFEYKKRPSFNPLIVHYSNVASVVKDVICGDVFYKLADKFSPGPLTYILRKKQESQITDFATAGLETVAVRIPNHIWAQKILERVKFPLAAPSANLSTKLTTTTAKNVAESLQVKDLLILDGGKSVVGIESTVIDLTAEIPVILRHGIISREEISDVLQMNVLDDDESVKNKCPGRMIRHYATNKPLIINAGKSIDGGVGNCSCVDGFLTFGDFDVKNISAKIILNLSPSGDLREAASNLFAMLKELDDANIEKIYVCPIVNAGIGRAINDRLFRASSRE